MFDIKKFGKAFSNLRKNADMTQNEVADKLNLSRQAVSKYERGESFPDISVLVSVADLFNITLDQLIGYGEPTNGESLILKNVAKGEDIVAENISDVVNLAPLLKPSVLTKLSRKFSEEGIDISHIVALSEYLNDETVTNLIEKASFKDLSEEVLEKFIPLLSYESKEIIFHKIIVGELDWHLLKTLSPYGGFVSSQIEAAYMEGIIPREAFIYYRGLD
ncbi:MAG: helix-turn-helix transcriptional regulator [Clostridia bacterium]|nr:helix-turn-helix transcriptional regulator [Clostridia bacterium]